MKIASWNINGIKARLDNLLNWLAESQPDIACLQEVKSVDENFPREPIEALGYHVETHGQKGFNGVALLSKMRSDEINRGLPMLPGDYNVIPEPYDCRDPAQWEGDALYHEKSRSALRRLENLGFTETIRNTTDAVKVYSFWDYQAGAWPKNNGIRIDHLMLSPEAANRLQSADIEKHVRGWEKPSDHVPVIAQLDFEAA